jgi:hypothetical protein
VAHYKQRVTALSLLPEGRLAQCFDTIVLIVLALFLLPRNYMSLTFTLRGVDTKGTTNLQKKQAAGTSKPSERLIKSTKSLIIRAPTKEHSFFERSALRTSLRSRFNEVLVNKRGDEYPLDCHYGCDWCRRQFETPPLGIPLNYRLGEDGAYRYQCDGYHCSFECALAFIRRDNTALPRRRDVLYRDSEPLLKNMFHKLYPDRKLYEAVDWRLMRDNGGDLSQQEEESARITPYTRTANVKLTPMAVVYQQY